MSKKLYTERKWKRYMRARQLYALERQRRQKERARSVRHTKRRIPRKTRHLKLPLNFSVINNPEETIRFLQEMEVVTKKFHVILNLNDTSKISIDAITGLIACMKKRDATTQVSGNHPTDATARDILIQSGFFSYVRSHRKLPTCKLGKITRQPSKSKKVEPMVARDLIHFGNEVIHGHPSPCRAAY